MELRQRAAAARCPYCHDLLAREPDVACPDCGTLHHSACLAELGGCTALGCDGRRPATRVEELRSRVRRRASRYAARRPAPEDREAILRRRDEQLALLCPGCQLAWGRCPRCGHEGAGSSCRDFGGLHPCQAEGCGWDGDWEQDLRRQRRRQLLFLLVMLALVLVAAHL